MLEDQDTDWELESACSCNLALAYIKLGHHNDAEEVCNEVLRLSPSSSKARYRRGQARLAAGKAHEALGDFNAIAILEPENVEVLDMIKRAEEETMAKAGRNQPDSSTLVDTAMTQNPIQSSRHPKASLHSNAPHLEEGTKLCVQNLREVCREGTTRDVGEEGIIRDVSCEERQGAEPQHHDVAESAQDQSLPSLGTTGFMVSGWLKSAEREQAEQTLHRIEGSFSGSISGMEYPPNDPRKDSNGHVETSDASVGVRDELRRNIAEIVHNRRKKAVGQRHTGEGDIKLAESEWVELDAAEEESRDAFRRRLERTKYGKPQDVSQKIINMKGSSKEESVLHESAWKSLVEQEKQLRAECRAKLGSGKGRKTNWAPSSLR